MINTIDLVKKVSSENVAQSEIKRLTFAFKLSDKTNTLPDHLDNVIEVFTTFNRERDPELTPDCMRLQFDAYSSSNIDLSLLYRQLKEFVDPFVTKGWHAPALLVNTHHTNKKQSTLTLVLTWQDKTYEQYIKRPNPSFWGE